MSEEDDRPRWGSERASGGTTERGACETHRRSVAGLYASPKSLSRILDSERENLSEALPSQIGETALDGTLDSSG